MNDRIYVRYAIQNQGQSIYRPGTPGVFSLRSPRSPSSLYALSKSQLVGDALRIKSDGQAPVKVVSAQVHANAVPPGGNCMGPGRVRTADWAEQPHCFEVCVPTRCGRRGHRSTGSVTPWNPNSRSRPRPFCGGGLSAGFPTFRRRHFCSIAQRPRRRISEAIRRRFAQSPDAGVLKRLANVVLEPPNPFNPNARRRPRQGAVILAALIFAALGLAFYFNITAVAR